MVYGNICTFLVVGYLVVIQPALYHSVLIMNRYLTQYWLHRFLCPRFEVQHCQVCVSLAKMPFLLRPDSSHFSCQLDSILRCLELAPVLD